MKKFFSKHWLKILLAVLALILALSLGMSDTFAQGLSGGGEGLQIAGTEDVTISGDIDKRPLGDVIKSMVNFFIGFLGFIAVIMFVYAGVLWVVSGGSEEQITKAKKIMTYAALGLLIVIMSFSIVRFITSSAGGGQQCSQDTDCQLGFSCGSGNICEADDVEVGAICLNDSDCSSGSECVNSTCSAINDLSCLLTADCGPGQYCGGSGECKQATNVACNDNSDCDTNGGESCGPSGFCYNPTAGSGATCQDSSDCGFGYACNEESNSCELHGSSSTGGVNGGATQALSQDALDNLDDTIAGLAADLGDIEDEINGLPSDVKDDVLAVVSGGTLSDKMSGVNTLIENSDDPTAIAVLEKLLRGLERLELLREQMDSLREVMPESEDTILSWDETSNALDELIDEPTSNIKLRRFEKMYRELREFIRQFPVVQSKIKAAPGAGNVPFTVTFDGLDSSDPTGGTISDYKWSFIDNDGNLVSLGNSPVVIHEFTEPNTYSVNLQVSTNNVDDSGYKTAMDGISTVRVKANIPSSEVAFRINGTAVRDVHHVTLDEAKAGIAFDPSITIPAIGRTIEKYEWFYGDTKSEERTVPATVIHGYDKPGEFFVTLKVTDNQGTSDKRVIKLIVKSLAADIEFIPAEGNVNTEFRFRGINSRSDDGIIRSFEWLINDSTGRTVSESELENFYYTFERPGTYSVELLVTDTSGAKDRSIRELNVFSRNPVASFTHSIPDRSHPSTVEFSGISSYDPDQGDQITYSWDFDGDGQFEIVDSKDILTEYTYRRTGQYKASLQVQDSFGKRSQIEKNVSIDSVLSADILIDKKAAQVGETITFKVDSLSAVAYLWEFGDGETTSTEENSVTHQYSKKGKYNVKLNFFDREDNGNVANSFVLIGEGDGPISVADVLVDGRNQVLVDDLCGDNKHGYIVTRSDNLSFSGRNSINRDGSSRLLSYDWKFNNGTRNSKKDFTHRFDTINPTGQCSSLSLAVRDDISGAVSDADTLYFKVINKLPQIIDFVVESETSRSLVTPTKVKLQVVGAKDEDGQIKKYKWWYYREGFEDEKLGVHSTSSSSTEMIITAEGQPDVLNKYFFAVEITDNDNGSYDTTERFGDISFLEVANGPNLSPVAEFTVDKTTIAVGDSITFISQSYDPQGEELPATAFRWDFDGDGAYDDTSSGSQINRQFNTPGEYETRLNVVHRGLSSSATRSVFVEPTNSYPQAAFTYQINGNQVKFNGDPSRYDPDIADTNLRFEWDFDIAEDANGNGINDDDVESTEVTPNFTYGDAGLYRARLKVKDSLGQEGVVVRDINLNLSASERERNTYHSLGLSAPSQPITTMDISISPYQLSRGETTDIFVKVKNADNSPYYGQVFFEVLEGSGEFTPNPIEAKDGEGQTIYTAVDRGPVRIKITATSTYYGDVSEEVILNVK